MSGGYVLNFSNRTFKEFIADSTGREIYDQKYGGGSKASLLRAFWNLESNHLAGRLLGDLLSYMDELKIEAEAGPLDISRRAATRLLQGTPVIDVEIIDPKSPERDFAVLAKAIRDAIDKNEPETGLDRLHTYTIKYMRAVCQGRGLDANREKPLHSLIGEYLKCLKRGKEIESDMTETILKSSISVLEAFNRVRNDQSMAHDNPVLNYNESLLILNHVTSSIRFIMSIESKKKKQPEQLEIREAEALPF